MVRKNTRYQRAVTCAKTNGIGSSRFAELLGGEGVDQTDIETSGGKSILHGVMVTPSSFDSDDHIEQAMSLSDGAYLGDGCIKLQAIVGNPGGRDKDVTIEIGKQELGACLGGIDADDAEVFRADFLDRGCRIAHGLCNDSVARLCEPLRREEEITVNYLQKETILLGVSQVSLRGRLGGFFRLFSIKTPYQGRGRSSWTSSVTTPKPMECMVTLYKMFPVLSTEPADQRATGKWIGGGYPCTRLAGVKNCAPRVTMCVLCRL